MPNFQAVQLASHNLGIAADILDMESDQIDEYLAIAMSDGSIHIERIDQSQEVDNVQQVATMKFHDRPVTSVRWLPIHFGRVLVSGCEGGRLTVIREQNQAFQRVVGQELSHPISDISVCENIIAVATLDNKVYIYKIDPMLKLEEQRVINVTIPLSCALLKVQQHIQLIVGTFNGEVLYFKDLDSEPERVDSSGISPCNSVAIGTDIITDFVSLVVGYSDMVRIFKLVGDQFQRIDEKAINDVSRVKISITGRVAGIVTGSGTTELMDIMQDQ